MTSLRHATGPNCIEVPEMLSSEVDALLREHAHLLLIAHPDTDERLLRAASGRADPAPVTAMADGGGAGSSSLVARELHAVSTSSAGPTRDARSDMMGPAGRADGASLQARSERWSRARLERQGVAFGRRAVVV